jgi:hypothetical protein
MESSAGAGADASASDRSACGAGARAGFFLAKKGSATVVFQQIRSAIRAAFEAAGQIPAQQTIFSEKFFYNK